MKIVDIQVKTSIASKVLTSTLNFSRKKYVIYILAFYII